MTILWLLTCIKKHFKSCNSNFWIIIGEIGYSVWKWFWLRVTPDGDEPSPVSSWKDPRYNFKFGWAFLTLVIIKKFFRWLIKNSNINDRLSYLDSWYCFLFTQVTYLNPIAICCMIPVFRTDILQTQNTTIWPQGFMWLKDIFLFLPLLGKSKTHTLREEKKVAWLRIVRRGVQVKTWHVYIVLIESL